MAANAPLSTGMNELGVETIVKPLSELIRVDITSGCKQAGLSYRRNRRFVGRCIKIIAGYNGMRDL